MGFAYNTATATTASGENKPIQDFATGDSVLAGSPSAGSGLSWKPATVKFSQCTVDEHSGVMVYIHFGENNIICTPDQPFLMPDGKIKRADRLVPGIDRLVDGEGRAVEISEVSIGEFRGGVHAIATDIEFKGSLDNHLLLTAGVVTGDFCIEINLRQLFEQGLAVEDAEQSAV